MLRLARGWEGSRKETSACLKLQKSLVFIETSEADLTPLIALGVTLSASNYDCQRAAKKPAHLGTGPSRDHSRIGRVGCLWWRSQLIVMKSDGGSTPLDIYAERIYPAKTAMICWSAQDFSHGYPSDSRAGTDRHRRVEVRSLSICRGSDCPSPRRSSGKGTLVNCRRQQWQP